MLTSDDRPTIVFIQGAFQTKEVYKELEDELRGRGFPVVRPELPSCTKSKSLSLFHCTLIDDALRVRLDLTRLIEYEEKTVVVVMHAYGGLVGSEAIPIQLSYNFRHNHSCKGGVLHMYFYTATVIREGASMSDMPRPTYLNGYVFCGRICLRSPVRHLYHDLSEGHDWERCLISQSPEVQKTKLTRAAYHYISSTYLVCTADRTTSQPVQEAFARTAKADINYMHTGHSPHIKDPASLANNIISTIDRVSLTRFNSCPATRDLLDAILGDGQTGRTSPALGGAAQIRPALDSARESDASRRGGHSFRSSRRSARSGTQASGSCLDGQSPIRQHRRLHSPSPAPSTFSNPVQTLAIRSGNTPSGWHGSGTLPILCRSGGSPPSPMPYHLSSSPSRTGSRIGRQTRLPSPPRMSHSASPSGHHSSPGRAAQHASIPVGSESLHPQAEAALGLSGPAPGAQVTPHLFPVSRASLAHSGVGNQDPFEFGVGNQDPFEFGDVHQDPFEFPDLHQDPDRSQQQSQQQSQWQGQQQGWGGVRGSGQFSPLFRRQP